MTKITWFLNLVIIIILVQEFCHVFMGLNFQGANAVADARESGGEVSGTSGLPFWAKEMVKEGL